MPELTATSTYHLRQERLAHAINAASLDALALNPGPSLTYLTGLHFHLLERPVVAIFTPNGAYFIHRTGHGLGMEEHEETYIRSYNTQLLTPGMTFKVEPGIYLPGRGGVRIEGNVVITESGSESLSDLPRGLKVVG